MNSCLGEPHVMSQERESTMLLPSPRPTPNLRLISAINLTLDSNILKMCNQHFEDILLAGSPAALTQLHQHSHKYGNRQKLITVAT